MTEWKIYVKENVCDVLFYLIIFNIFQHKQFFFSLIVFLIFVFFILRLHLLKQRIENKKKLKTKYISNEKTFILSLQLKGSKINFKEKISIG